ncbi:MAG TPA: nitroreductase [Smithella sp.]|nr:nitroreductase family protein [Smithella sp.]MDM7986590.1 nitroreductase [Smithella sp.]HNY49137.1 nitroreductase [Smithella sp.]HOG90459.1 nitroreductase [Smithella sp.]HOU49583.1 nitroreductase [Smithella sp.]
MAKKPTDNLSPLYTYQEGMEWNPVEKVIIERRSNRNFKKKPVPNNLIRRVLEAGRFSPTAGNAQPWKFVVITDQDLIAEMERATVKMSKLLMWFVDYNRNAFRRIFLTAYTKFLTRLMPNKMHPVPFNLLQQIAAEKTPIYHNAPVMILLLMDKRGIGNPALDAGICGQNIVLAAHSLGLGTCWIGMMAVLMMNPLWRKKLGVTSPYELSDCIVLGWPKGDYDGEVSREVQLVEWIEAGGVKRTERQGV